MAHRQRRRSNSPRHAQLVRPKGILKPGIEKHPISGRGVVTGGGVQRKVRFRHRVSITFESKRGKRRFSAFVRSIR
jgi:hypothetical protein